MSRGAWNAAFRIQTMFYTGSAIGCPLLFFKAPALASQRLASVVVAIGVEIIFKLSTSLYGTGVRKAVHPSRKVRRLTGESACMT
jgi:hypothetical protein